MYDPGVRVGVYVNATLAGEVTESISVGPTLYGRRGLLDWPSIHQRRLGLTFEGNIDEVAVYSEALSRESIASHYFAAASNKSDPVLYVDRNTGHIRFENSAFAGSDLPLQGYSIVSNARRIGSVKLVSITDNYDQGNVGPDQVDADDDWTVLWPRRLHQFERIPVRWLARRWWNHRQGKCRPAERRNCAWLPGPDETDLVATIAYSDGTIEEIPVPTKGMEGLL